MKQLKAQLQQNNKIMGIHCYKKIIKTTEDPAIKKQ